MIKINLLNSRLITLMFWFHLSAISFKIPISEPIITKTSLNNNIDLRTTLNFFKLLYTIQDLQIRVTTLGVIETTTYG